MSGSQRDDWILMTEAPERIGRSRRTIYRWIDEGRVRTMRPLTKLWLNVPDLVEADRETIRRTRAEMT